MKYIKTYENETQWDERTQEYLRKDEFKKKLSSLFVNLFSSAGYDYENYYNRGNYETVFILDSKFQFRIIVKAYTLDNLIITIITDEKEILEFFLSIKGIDYLGNEPFYNVFDDKNFVISTKNYDKLFREIKDKFDLFQDTKKYNL